MARAGIALLFWVIVS